MPAEYVIAELKGGEVGGFAPRGAVKTLWKDRSHESLVSGPAETGKTYGALQYVDALLWRFPGAQGVMTRKTYSSLVGSAIRTYLRIIGDRSPVKAYGGEKPEWFDYPNGSRLWVGGLDNPQKILSSERDFIYVNQAEELTIDDWETLITRCTGRGAVMPYTKLFGDCNPGPPTHWIKQREKEGKLKLFPTTHEDNPTLFDDQGKVLPQGVRTLEILDNLSGVRKERLRYGRWVQAEGVVYEAWDTQAHIIKRNDPRFGLQNGIPSTWPRYWDVDFGFTNPFVWQAWALDPDGRLFCYRQIYKTQTLVSDHCETIRRITQGDPRPVKIVCDHDAEDRATLERCLGVTTIAAHKSISDGIQAVQNRLKAAGDGKPRLFFLENSLVEADQSLLARKQPVSTEQEFEIYAYPQDVDGRAMKETPVKQYDHGLDGLRYLVAEVDQIGDRPPQYKARVINSRGTPSQYR